MCDGSLDRSFTVDPLSNFSFQPVHHDWCNKGRGICYHVCVGCGVMHIKEPLLLIGKNILCGGSGFLLSLSEWSFTICLTPYNRIEEGRKCFISLSLFFFLNLYYPLPRGCKSYGKTQHRITDLTQIRRFLTHRFRHVDLITNNIISVNLDFLRNVG